MKHTKQSRRYFLKSVGFGLLIPLGLLWNKLVKTENGLALLRKQSLLFNPNKPISFQDGFIIVNKEGQTNVFSSQCTHLGCTINKSDGERLLCPCHGSVFDLDGNAIKGPATRPLKVLNFSIDKLSNQITVEV